MGVNSLPKTVTRQRRACDLNPGPSAPESSTVTTRLPIEPPLLLVVLHFKTHYFRWTYVSQYPFWSPSTVSAVKHSWNSGLMGWIFCATQPAVTSLKNKRFCCCRESDIDPDLRPCPSPCLDLRTLSICFWFHQLIARITNFCFLVSFSRIKLAYVSFWERVKIVSRVSSFPNWSEMALVTLL